MLDFPAFADYAAAGTSQNNPRAQRGLQSRRDGFVSRTKFTGDKDQQQVGLLSAERVFDFADGFFKCQR